MLSRVARFFRSLHRRLFLVTIHTPSVVINIYRGNSATVLERLNSIMETQAEAAARIAELGVKLDKISGETTGLVEAVRDLKEKAGNADPALSAAIDAVLGKADAVDALVDDVAPNPTPTPPVEDPAAP